MRIGVHTWTSMLMARAGRVYLENTSQFYISEVIYSLRATIWLLSSVGPSSSTLQSSLSLLLTFDAEWLGLHYHILGILFKGRRDLVVQNSISIIDQTQSVTNPTDMRFLMIRLLPRTWPAPILCVNTTTELLSNDNHIAEHLICWYCRRIKLFSRLQPKIYAR